jgi:hypothetical protein
MHIRYAVEKLLLSDISTATAKYAADRQKARGELKDRLTANPSQELRNLARDLVSTQKEVERITEDLHARAVRASAATPKKAVRHGLRQTSARAYRVRHGDEASMSRIRRRRI